MSNNQLNQKQFKSFDCNGEVKLQRKDDNSGGIRYNIDGVTLHECPAKKKKLSSKQTQQVQQSPLQQAQQQQL